MNTISMHNRIKPNLVSHKMVKRIGKILQNPVKDEPTWKDNLMIFYDEYIRPNMFAILVLFLVAIFLTIKYLLKQEREDAEIKQKKKKRKTKKNMPIEKQVDILLPYDDNNDNNDNNYNNNETVRDDSDRRIYADDEEIRDTDEVSFYSLRKEYEKSLKNNEGGYSDMMMNDELNQRKAKMTFNELAKMVSGN